jgi:ribosome-binding factor A
VAKRERTRRHLQIGEALKRRLAALIAEGLFRDSVPELFSITEVRPSGAYESAVIFVSAADFEALPKIVEKLNSIAGRVRFELAQTAELRSTPRLIFKADNASEYAENIERLLETV